MPVEWVMLSNHLFPCRPLLLLPLWLSDVCKLWMRPGHGVFAPYPIQSQGARPPLSTGPLAEPWGRLGGGGGAGRGGGGGGLLGLSGGEDGASLIGAPELGRAPGPRPLQ